MLSVADGYGSLAMRADARRAEKLMNGISFGPEALKAIAAAFDAAWGTSPTTLGANPPPKRQRGKG
jgi:hypothetical protein